VSTALDLVLERTRGTSFVCDTCGASETFVKDTRPTRFGEHAAIRRRRVCGQCKARFTTIEIQADALERIAAGDPAVATALVRDVEQAVQRLGNFYRAKR
jgi:transcriptional regulator NrdR family protein